MIWYTAFVVCRAMVALFAVLTAAYGVAAYSPFAFQVFIRPRVFAPVNQFVAWHHILYLAVYLLSVITLIPDVKQPRTRWLALAYIAAFGLIGEWLFVTPYLPKLWNDIDCLVVALVSFVPVAWLALIDHVAAPPGATLAAERTRPTNPWHVLMACLIASEYLWLTYLLRAIVMDRTITGASAWLLVAVWSAALHALAFMLVYAIVVAIVGIAAVTRQPALSEYALMVALIGVAIGTVLRRILLPTISLGQGAGLAVASAAGVGLAATWSGFALRRPRSPGAGPITSLECLTTPLAPANGTAFSAIALAVLPILCFTVIGRVEKFDWNSVLQNLTVVVGWILTFAFALSLARHLANRASTLTLAVVPPLIALAAMFGIVRTSSHLFAWTGNPSLQDDVALDPYAAADPSFRFAYQSLIEHPGADPQFFRYLLANTSLPPQVPITLPDVEFSPGLRRSAAKPPAVFLFVVDSLRQDYLSPYNPAVTFTPNIAAFAAESFAFRNAFTRYGGTALAVPSIWAGGLLMHRLNFQSFHRINAIEKLLDAEDYQRFVGMDSVATTFLTRGPSLTELDQNRTVMKFDFCQTLDELEQKLSDRRDDQRPAFAYTLPQTMHISLVFTAQVPAGESYPGFFAPYASRLRRIDGCFGHFVSFLKRTGLYDDSIIVLTSDHGDLLGENGLWGHGVPLFAEVLRIPLIVHIPKRMTPTVAADLDGIVFSTDIAPTLYELTGHPTRDLGELFGRPLFVPADRPLGDDRRRGSFVAVSSYAPTYAMVRRNGRALYIVDLVNGREYQLEMTTRTLGVRTAVTEADRRVNRTLIRDQVAELAAFYHFAPEP